MTPTPLTLTAWADEVLREFEEVRRLEEKMGAHWDEAMDEPRALNHHDVEFFQAAIVHIPRLAAQLAQLPELVELVRASVACDVCAGTGEPVSGRPCLCRGSGDLGVAMTALREKYETLVERVKRLEAVAAVAMDVPVQAAWAILLDDQDPQAKRNEVMLKLNRLAEALDALKAGEEKG